MEDLAALKTSVKKFCFKKSRFGSQGFSRLLIQVFGPAGHGKSSFINTCKYVWDDGPFNNIAQSSSDDGGHTMVRISYPLTKKITLVDNRGYKNMDFEEAGEIFAQLGNLLPIDQPVDWNDRYRLDQRIRISQCLVKFSDFIVPVFIHSATKHIDSREIRDYRAWLTMARDITGVFPIVVITHKTQKALEEQKLIFRNIGVERIFAIENYTFRNHIRTRGRDAEVLMFLNEVIRDVQFRLSQKRNPEREMMERKEKIFTYIRQCEKQKERVKQAVEEREERHLERLRIKLRRVKEEKPSDATTAEEQRIRELELEIQKLQIGTRTHHERRHSPRRKSVRDLGEQSSDSEDDYR
ncbi:uncharacterized protein RCH25_037989 [Pelodytes ibericus]